MQTTTTVYGKTNPIGLKIQRTVYPVKKESFNGVFYESLVARKKQHQNVCK